MNQYFGPIRSLLHETSWTKDQHEEFRERMEDSYLFCPGRHEAEVIPYAQTFKHHFRGYHGTIESLAHMNPDMHIAPMLRCCLDLSRALPYGMYGQPGSMLSGKDMLYVSKFVCHGSVLSNAIFRKALLHHPNTKYVTQLELVNYWLTSNNIKSVIQEEAIVKFSRLAFRESQITSESAVKTFLEPNHLRSDVKLDLTKNFITDQEVRRAIIDKYPNTSIRGQQKIPSWFPDPE